MARREQPRAGLSDVAYHQLRVGLVACSFAPGSRLNISRLQKELGVSQAALREALSRLTAEGLVVSEHNAGFRATPVLASGYGQLAAACNVIEEQCLRSAIRNGDDTWERQLHRIYRSAVRGMLPNAAEPVAVERYVMQREKFHRALFSACDNTWLLAAWSMLYTQHMRYRQWFVSLAKFESHLFGDYKHFLGAISRRHEEEAVALWSENHRKVVAFIEGDAFTDRSGATAIQ